MDPHDVVVVAQRTKATVRLADGRTIQRIYSKGQKVTAAEAERFNISVHPDKKKPQPKTLAEKPAPPADPFTCPDCGFVAKTENGLQSHRRSKHGGD